MDGPAGRTGVGRVGTAEPAGDPATGTRRGGTPATPPRLDGGPVAADARSDAAGTTSALPDLPVFDAVVLAGGTARRLGGIDKAALVVDGSTLLDRVVLAVDRAASIVVVGPRRPTDAAVRWRREQPPGGGPVAGIAAGLPVGSAGVVVTLAADLPWIAPAVPLLLDAVRASDVAVLVDGAGHRNHLAAAWGRDALGAALAAAPVDGRPARTLFTGLDVVEVADTAGWGQDCDTPADLAAARAGRPSA